MSRMIKVLTLFALMTVVGCSGITSVKDVIPAEKPDKSMMVKCPEELPLLEGLTRADVIATYAAAGAIYHDCKDTHNSLVDLPLVIDNASY